MNDQEYIKNSLELHLFFDRILKEHSLFLAVSFTEKDTSFKKTASNFQKIFANILNNVVNMANHNLSDNFLLAKEIVTSNTLKAENKTSFFTNIPIRTDITIKEMNLQSGSINSTKNFVQRISILNKDTLSVIKKLIDFKNNILNNILTCKMFTTNYPLLIKHIKNEAIMYYNLLEQIERRKSFTNQYIEEQEIFWDNIMMEHAKFIRGLLDPSEKNLIQATNQYANEYEMILKKTNNFPSNIQNSLQETLKFQNFKTNGLNGILNCQTKSTVLPLLADHILREANHFIRILRSFIVR